MTQYNYKELGYEEQIKNKVAWSYSYLGTQGQYSFAERRGNDVFRSMNWITCRESFCNIWSSTWKNSIIGSNVLYLIAPSEVIPLLGALTATEQRLNLKGRSTIHTLYSENKNPPSAIYIEPFSWWKKNDLRKQFFSMLIRAGRCFDGDLESTLFNTNIHNNYFHETKRATQKFLDGHTSFDYSSTAILNGTFGWATNFRFDANLSRMKPALDTD